jgi:uncharacterized protein YjbI with pentapeptide repeats
MLASAAAVALVWPVTDLLAAHDAGTAVTGIARAGQLQTAREAVRTQLLTLGAGIFAAGALVFTARNFTLTRQGQVSDRYSKAVEQLGSDKIDVRIGGIYALERVARDSSQDHPTVIEVLCAFIREHSRDQRASSGDDESQPRPAADVQAALTVVGRRNRRHDIRRLDLTHTILHGARLDHGNFSRADFHGADLRHAQCAGADLSGALLFHANLSRAFLGGTTDGQASDHVNLKGAILIRADLTGANVCHADLRDANLDGTNLTGSYAEGADLTGAYLRNPDLTDADLTDVRWPEAEPVPTGWHQDTTGLLKPGPGR